MKREKKLISLSDEAINKLELLAKKSNLTKSQVVEILLLQVNENMIIETIYNLKMTEEEI